MPYAYYFFIDLIRSIYDAKIIETQINDNLKNNKNPINLFLVSEKL